MKSNIDSQLLHDHVQRDLSAWLSLPGELRPRKEHIEYMRPWKLHPVRDLSCSYEDIVFMRLPVDLMLDLDLGFARLHEDYHVTADVLRLFKYSWGDWVKLGITKMFVMEIGRDQLQSIFGISLEYAMHTAL
jgi:hypothetical protein